MDWRYGSSSRAPALQVPSPEVKSQIHQKKKKKETKKPPPVLMTGSIPAQINLGNKQSSKTWRS
jgi:hypothetical protein